MRHADILIVGGGIAGVSAAAALAPHGRVLVLEAESALGYHSSGRSATFFHFGIGNAVVRALTACSRAHFETAHHGDAPVSRETPALFVAAPDMLDGLHALKRDMAHFTDALESVDERQVAATVPVLRCGEDGVVAGVMDHSARRIDSDALLQSYRSTLRRRGGDTVPDARIVALEHRGDLWVARTAGGEAFGAPLLVNAAGAWADEVATMAGVAPLGLRPLRRTMIVVDAPEDPPARDWPFTKTAVDDFYMLPEGGRLMASPVDEHPSVPTDARPDDYDVAVAAAKVEEYTTLNVRRIHASWAGLRTFAQDRTPVVGFAPDADGFFWLAGQGGFGLQTAPAISSAVEALITRSSWPQLLASRGIDQDILGPDRLMVEAARCGPPTMVGAS